MSRACRLGAIVFVALLGLSGLAHAHARSQSFSSWNDRGETVSATFTVLSREATRLGVLDPESGAPLETMLAGHLEGHVGARRGESACTWLEPPRPVRARAGYLRVEMRFTCPEGGPLEIRSEAFFALAPSHIHFARVRAPGSIPIEYLFTDTERTRRIGAPGQAGEETDGEREGATLAGYVRLGVEHILAGLDHLAFLGTLLLLSRRPRDVLVVVTGFTVGHSLSLSLAVLGVVEVEPAWVEALIGFSIALVALENGLARGASSLLVRVASLGLLGAALVSAAFGLGPDPMLLAGLALFTACYLPLATGPSGGPRFRAGVTALFGLVHGFGFASALLEVGLPPGRLALGLFGFNVGVELGQLAVVAAVAPAGFLLRRVLSGGGGRLLEELLAAGLCGLGLYWFVLRAYS